MSAPTRAHESNGYWYADVAGAHPGQGYKYRLVTQDTVFEQIDPYAREVTHFGGIPCPSFDNQSNAVSRALLRLAEDVQPF